MPNKYSVSYFNINSFSDDSLMMKPLWPFLIFKLILGRPTGIHLRFNLASNPNFNKNPLKNREVSPTDLRVPSRCKLTRL